MWDLPTPGIELVSPALAGGFFTTKPPGNPRRSVFMRVLGYAVNRFLLCQPSLSRDCKDEIQGNCGRLKALLTRKDKVAGAGVW